MSLFKKETCCLCGGKTGLPDKKCMDGAQYYCVITDEAGASVTSDVAILTVTG